MAEATKTFTLEDCKEHSSEKDCWLAISGKVYDVTDFLDEHPGELGLLRMLLALNGFHLL